MVGKVFITASGYDPQLGKAVKDPYLGDPPTLGACRPDIRARLQIGDYVFVITGKVKDCAQFVMAAFQVDEKIPMSDAFNRFPHLRLRRGPDGELTGNIILDADGNQHELDHHPKETFENRIDNYIVGKNLISPTTRGSISRARAETAEVLRATLGKKDGNRPIDIVTRSGADLSESQVDVLRSWMEDVCKV